MSEKRKLTPLIVALPEDYVIWLLACTRMQFGDETIPLQSAKVNQVVLQGIDRVFWELQGKYSYSKYWKSIQDLTKLDQDEARAKAE